MANQNSPPPILDMRGITKRFPGVLALNNVDFSVRRGEIHALIGQNGAGKSTLMKILAGDYPPTSGDISLNGNIVSFKHPRDAHQQGIAIVYQELSLLPNLTVAKNIFLGREPGSAFQIDDDAILKQARALLEQLGVDHIDVRVQVSELTLAQQQLVEIAKALSYEPQILILDEPTAALSQDDARRLFDILQRLKSQGIAIIYITHRFIEIIENCDRGTILRNGEQVETLEIPNTTEEELVKKMIGQEIETFYRHTDGTRVQEETLLSVERLSIGERVRNVNFTLRRGEILGITGLLGAGQNELARALFGVQNVTDGIIRRGEQPVSIQSPEQAIALGICLLTENRKDEGLFLDLSVKSNITMPSLFRFVLSNLFPFIQPRNERSAAKAFIDKVNVVLSSAEAHMRTLSGGNQQKTIIARWLLRDLEVLVFIEPTRGVDVGAKAEIYRYLDKLAKEGRGIIVISPELLEIIGLSDRILAMHQGQIVAEFFASETTEEQLLAAIQGTDIQELQADGNNLTTAQNAVTN